MEKRKDSLVKENEKLKADFKQKKQTFPHTGNARYLSGYSSMTGSNPALQSAMSRLNAQSKKD